MTRELCFHFEDYHNLTTSSYNVIRHKLWSSSSNSGLDSYLWSLICSGWLKNYSYSV